MSAHEATWRDVALRVGEALASVGPDGYYAMTPDAWCDWMLQQCQQQMKADSTELLQAVLDAIKGTLDPHTQIADHPNVKFAQMQRLRLLSRADAAEREAEDERLRLAACTTAALGNTPAAAADRFAPGHPYYSASYGDVCAAVDREMAYRAQVAEQAQAIARLQDTVTDLRAELEVSR